MFSFRKPKTLAQHCTTENEIGNLLLLLNAGASRRQLLHSAIRDNRPEIVRYLLDVGADVNETNQNGEFPLFLCVRYNRLDFARLLHSHGADATFQVGGQSLLYHAACAGHVDIVRFLTEECHAVGRGTPAIAGSIQSGCLAVTSYLLRMGTNPNYVFELRGELISLLDLSIAMNDMRSLTLLMACGADPKLVQSPLVTDTVRQRLRKYDRRQTARKLPAIDAKSLASIGEDLNTLGPEVNEVLEAFKSAEQLDLAASIACLRMCYSSFASLFREASRVSSPVVQFRDDLLKTLFKELTAEDVERVNRTAREDAKRRRKLFHRLPNGDQPARFADFFVEETAPPQITKSPDIPACLLFLNNQLLTIRPLLDQLVALFDHFHKVAVAFVNPRMQHLQGHLKTITQFRDLKVQDRLAKCGFQGETMEAIVAGHTDQGRYLDALAKQLEEQLLLFQQLRQTANRFITGLLL
jgi:hypothetical protein